MSIQEFLETVITTDEGNFCLLLGPLSSGFYKEEWYKWPDDKAAIEQRAITASQKTNVYFATGLFSDKFSTKDYLLTSRTISADLDEADIKNLPIEPTILVETSTQRHQAFWVLNEAENISLGDLELLSKRMTYSIENCDRSGWPLARKPRLPFTQNFKYNPSEPVSIVKEHGTYTVEVLDSVLLPLEEIPFGTSNTDEEVDWIQQSTVLEIRPLQLFQKYKQKLPSKIAQRYKVGAPEAKGGRRGETRSEMLWGLMTFLFRVGAERDEVYWLALHCTWNKFAEQRYNTERNLKQDVIRAQKAEQKQKIGSGIKEVVGYARKQPMGSKYERNAFISALVREHMQSVGELLTTREGISWYLRHDNGRPVYLNSRSDYLESLLENTYGLNASEPEQKFVVNHLIAWTKEQGRLVETSVLSWHNVHKKELLIHTGQKDVYVLTENTVSKTSNGQHDVLFTWNGADGFDIDYDKPIEDWAGFLLENFFNNLEGMSREDAFALVKTWFLFILFRNSAVNRPILTFFGQPGSGKSTLFRLIYALLYGPHKSLDSVTNQDNFDYTVASEPLVIFDNVDTWTNWLPDRLALASATSDITKRKLYTDSDTVKMKRQAIVGISAHNPKFGREDVVDRMLMLTFTKILDGNLLSEEPLVNKILENRTKLWGGIIQDVKKILSIPFPTEEEIPQFRITDFARYGYWISKALGCNEEFVQAIANNKITQTAYILREEDILIEALHDWVAHRNPKDAEAFWSPSALWGILEQYAPDHQGFVRSYKNAIQLGKKLWVMHTMLKTIFDIETQYEGKTGNRKWRICASSKK